MLIAYQIEVRPWLPMFPILAPHQFLKYFVKTSDPPLILNNRGLGFLDLPGIQSLWKRSTTL